MAAGALSVCTVCMVVPECESAKVRKYETATAFGRDPGFVDRHRTAPDGAPPLPASPPRTAGGEENFDPAAKSFLPFSLPPARFGGGGGGGGRPTIPLHTRRSSPPPAPPQPPSAVSREVGVWCPPR